MDVYSNVIFNNLCYFVKTFFYSFDMLELQDVT